MMVLSALRPDATLPEFLINRARSAALPRLAINALAGALILVAALWWEPAGKVVIVSAAACVCCYGIWGLLDRVRSRAGSHNWVMTVRLLDALCALCAGLGALAIAGVLLAIWAIALGTWIS